MKNTHSENTPPLGQNHEPIETLGITYYDPNNKTIFLRDPGGKRSPVTVFDNFGRPHNLGRCIDRIMEETSWPSSAEERADHLEKLYKKHAALIRVVILRLAECAAAERRTNGKGRSVNP
jgi:hypothetical protein